MSLDIPHKHLFALQQRLLLLPGVLVAVRVVLQDIMQEAVQQGSIASAGGHGAGASGRSADGIQVLETGQVLREET